MFGSSPEKLAAGVKAPQLLLPAGNDDDNVKPGGAVTELLASLPAPVGPACKSHHFPDMAHGWTTRGDMADANVKRDVELAVKMTKEFLDSLLL